MCLRPVVACEAHVVAQQKLPDPMASTHQIAAHILTRAHQIAQRLLAQRRHPDRRQLARHQQPHQKLGVTAIGLYPVLRRPRDLPRRRDHTPHPRPLERAGQPKARRPSLIGHPNPPGNPAQNAATLSVRPGSRCTRSSPDSLSTIAATTFAACTSSPTQHLACIASAPP